MANNVLKKLGVVQATLKAPKGQYNAFAKYNYRSCEDIIEAVKPLLNDESLVLNIADEIVLIGEGEQARFYVKATAKVIDVETGEHIEAVAYAREPDLKKGSDEAQITGASSSYARKYALNGLFAIDDEKDADAHDNRASGAQEAKPAKPWQKQASATAKGGLDFKAVVGDLKKCKDEDECAQWFIDLNKQYPNLTEKQQNWLMARRDEKIAELYEPKDF